MALMARISAAVAMFSGTRIHFADGLITKDGLGQGPDAGGFIPPSLECEVESTGPICFTGSGQTQVVLPFAMSPGLQAFWSFDGSLPLDESGNGIHGESQVLPGPAFAGQGASAYFHRTYLVVPDGKRLALQDFSYTFWVYLIDGPAHMQEGMRYCPIVRKGLDNTVRPTEVAPRYAAAPAILFDRETRKLRIELTTNDPDTSGPVGNSAGEVLESNARLRKGRWFHIAVVRLDGQRRTRLYVNGILDASMNTQGYTEPNDEPLYIGSDPLVSDSCDVPMYIDELKVYNRALQPDELQAEAAPALAGVEPSFVRLSCIACPLRQAVENCPQGYHICNSLELHLGGYQVARTLGWLERDARVWSHASAAAEAVQGGPAVPDVPGAAQPAAPAAAAVLAQTLAEMHGEIPASFVQVASEFGPAPAPGPAPGPAVPLGLGLCCADAL